MLDAVINQSFSTIVAASSGSSTSDARLFLNGVPYTGPAATVVQVPSSTTAWSVTFTPNATGTYSFYCFGAIQFRVQVVSKSLYSYLKNVEDEALGSWTWDKTSGDLTLLRADGSTLATFTVHDTLTEGSRERLT